MRKKKKAKYFWASLGARVFKTVLITAPRSPQAHLAAETLRWAWQKTALAPRTLHVGNVYSNDKRGRAGHRAPESGSGGGEAAPLSSVTSAAAAAAVAVAAAATTPPQPRCATPGPVWRRRRRVYTSPSCCCCCGRRCVPCCRRWPHCRRCPVASPRAAPGRRCHSSHYRTDLFPIILIVGHIAWNISCYP